MSHLLSALWPASSVPPCDMKVRTQNQGSHSDRIRTTKHVESTTTQAFLLYTQKIVCMGVQRHKHGCVYYTRLCTDSYALTCTQRYKHAHMQVDGMAQCIHISKDTCTHVPVYTRSRHKQAGSSVHACRQKLTHVHACMHSHIFVHVQAHTQSSTMCAHGCRVLELHMCVTRPSHGPRV